MIIHSLFNQRWMNVLSILGESFIVPIVVKKIDDSSDRKYRITITYMNPEEYEIYCNNNSFSKYSSVLDMNMDDDESYKEKENLLKSNLN